VKDVEALALSVLWLIVDVGGAMTVDVGSDWFGVSPLFLSPHVSFFGFNGRIRRRPMSDRVYAVE